MTPRLIGIALRRSLGGYFVPLFLAVEALNLFAHGRDWSITWAATSQLSTSIMILLGPLVAAGAAADSVENARHGTLLEVASPRAKWKAHVLRFIGFGVWALSCHLLGMLTAWIFAVVRHGRLGHPDLLVLLTGCIVLLAYVAAGIAIGVWAPKIVTPPALAVVLYALVPFVGVDDRFVVAVAGNTDLLGDEFVPSAVLLECLWFATCGALLLLVICRPHGLQLIASACCGVLAVAAAAVLLSSNPEVVRAQVHPDLVCRGERPQVCASAEVPQALGALQKKVPPLYRVAHDLYPDRPMHTAVGLELLHPRQGSVAVGGSIHPPYASADEIAAGFGAYLAGCHRELPIAADDDIRAISNYLLHSAGFETYPDLDGKARIPTRQGARAAVSRLENICR
ncbi:hypothetical protein [Flexivirga sp. B27]